MKVSEFENKIWETEGIRLIVRASSNSTVSDYDFKKGAQEKWSITKLIDQRIKPRIGDHEVIVIQGNGKRPNGRAILRTIRKEYT